MSMFESIIVSLICISIVFIVLAALFAMISILSKLIGAASNKNADGANTGKATAANMALQTAAAQPANVQPASDASSAVQTQAAGPKLINVDERTAAMIMAIVSHETKKPLSELVFKSISALD